MGRRKTWAAYAAALWALVFAVLHVVWAAGWYVGLNQESARKAFQQRWFLTYDLAVAGVCAVAVGVALALARQWGRRIPHALVAGLAWSGMAVLALRGGAGFVQTVYRLAAGRSIPFVVWIWDVWFCLGAVLFGLGAWRFGHVSRGIART